MALKKLLFAAAAFIAVPALAAEPVTAPSVTGQTGLLSMPDARIAPEGTWRSGISFMRPYQSIWSSLALFPWLEGSFRYTRIMDVPGFVNDLPGTIIDYGDYKDKSFDLKLRLLPERGAWPSVVLGAQDVQGTAIFRALYAAASKQIGNFDLTLGYGAKRIDGVFGGVRYTDPRLPHWSLVAEVDAFDYQRDHGALLSGAAAYAKAAAAGIEYRSEWWGAKAYAAHGEAGVNAWVSVPLEQKEFVPKIDEPPPFTKIVPRPTEAQWAASREHRASLARALYEQDFREVRFAYVNGVLSARLTNLRISSMPRAVGRAARTLLSFAPLEVREIRVTWLEGKLPLATYDFVDVPLLQRYFNGMASRAQLAQTVAIEYAVPGGDERADREAALSAFEEPIPERLLVQHGVEGSVLTLRDEDVLGGSLYLHPMLQAYFNDPAGALKFDVSAVASYERWFPGQVQLLGDLKGTLWENVSDVTQPSNSVLPHVRTDVAEYKRESRMKILRLVANKYFQPAERVYARVSGGIYEEMYDGVGGQVLYLPGDSAWAADLALDALKQRDFRGLFGTRDYSTATAIASLNYRMAHGLTATARAGRFLAKDEGVRFEMKRRYNSGFEVGAWYTFTNGKDITSPGTPSSPYHDKGIFISMPLETMVTKDTRAVAGFSLAPWTRDVGQMVQSPGDLYALTERDVLQMHARDGLEGVGDMDDAYTLPERAGGPRQRVWPDFVAGDARGIARSGGEVNWWKVGLFGAGLTLASSSPGFLRLSLRDRSQGFELEQERRSPGQRAAGARDRDVGPVRLRRLAPAPVGRRHRRARGEQRGAARLARAQIRHRPRAPERGAGQGRLLARLERGPLPLLPLQPHGRDLGRGHALRPGVRHAVALRRGGAHRPRARRQPRALGFGHRGGLAHRLRPGLSCLGRAAPRAPGQGPPHGADRPAIGEPRMAARLTEKRGQTTFSRKRGLTPFLLILLALSTPALACGVIDPELQGGYAGPCANGLAEGEGYATGFAEYRGHFKAGRKDGKGVKTWPNGDRYEGDFVDGRKEGRGSYTWGRGRWQGERYEGQFENDRRNGAGSYRYADGDVYRGEWKDDVPVGAPTPMMLAQRRFRAESRKAVAKQGQKVCRAMRVGIAHREWVRGTVVGVEGDKVAVRIDEPGSHGETIAGVDLKKGEIVWDEPYGWTPCL